MGSEGWFDNSKLLPDERFVRRGAARLHLETAPHWWQGTLVLTSERLMFFAANDSPATHDHAFWLADVRQCGDGGRNRFSVSAGETRVTFALVDGPGSLRSLAGRSARPWMRLIRELRASAHAHPQLDTTPHRAVG